MTHSTTKQGLLFNNPAYPINEAARILNLPASTVKAWCFGQNYTAPSGEKKISKPVIRPADESRRLLSFANLCELHVLSGMRRYHKIALFKVRDSMEYLRKKLLVDCPLIDHQFCTNGIDLFVEHAAQLLAVNREGQAAMRGEFEQALARIERDNRGAPVRLFPFSRTALSGVEQPRAIVIDPQLSFGRPVLTRAAVPTEVIVDRFCAGDSPAEMAKDYSVDEKDIQEALRFEQRLAA